MCCGEINTMLTNTSLGQDQDQDDDQDYDVGHLRNTKSMSDVVVK